MTKPCKILQTTQEILPSTCCHNIFETCNIFELILTVGATYFPQNCTIILKKHPKSSRCSWINVTKKWAMFTMLKALPLVHFSNALLLRERIKISVEIKQMANRLIYFFLASPNKLFNLLSFLRKTRSKCTIFPFCGRFLVSLCWLLHTVACKLCKL